MMQQSKQMMVSGLLLGIVISDGQKIARIGDIGLTSGIGGDEGDLLRQAHLVR